MTGLPLGDYRLFQWPFEGFLRRIYLMCCAPYLITCVSVDRPRRLGFLVCLAGTQHAWFYPLAFLYAVDRGSFRFACAAAQSSRPPDTIFSLMTEPVMPET
jgi:hypothetical protein